MLTILYLCSIVYNEAMDEVLMDEIWCMWCVPVQLGQSTLWCWFTPGTCWYGADWMFAWQSALALKVGSYTACNDSFFLDERRLYHSWLQTTCVELIRIEKILILSNILQLKTEYYEIYRVRLKSTRRKLQFLRNGFIFHNFNTKFSAIIFKGYVHCVQVIFF